MTKEKTFVIDKDDKRGGWRCPDLQTQFVLFSKFGNSGSEGIKITLRKVFDDLTRQCSHLAPSIKSNTNYLDLLEFHLS